MGRTLVVVCQKCGHEYTVEYIDREEALKRRIQTVSSPPACPKCGSGNVKVHK